MRSLAHRLKPIVHVGTDGVSAALLASLDEALNTRELLKVRVLDGAPANARETAQQLRDGLEGLFVPLTIGKTVVVYRPFPEDPEIKLPKPGGASD